MWTQIKNEGAQSEDTDQPGHPPNLIRVFAVHSTWVAKDPNFLNTDSHIVVFLILQLKYNTLPLSCFTAS